MLTDLLYKIPRKVSASAWWCSYSARLIDSSKTRHSLCSVPGARQQLMSSAHDVNRMSTVKLHGFSTEIPLQLTEDLTLEQLEKFPAFQTWLSSLRQSLQHQSSKSHTFYNSPYTLRSIEVQSCDFFGGGSLGFVKLKAEISNDNGEKLPGSVFLRGGSVAMLLILCAGSSAQEYVILTVQPRIAAGSLGFVELPAGMIDDSGSFSGAAAKEIMEETGLEIGERDLVDMTNLALSYRTGDQGGEESHLQKGIYPSPGGCDEFIPIFLARKQMTEDEVEATKGKLTGLRDHGEKITLKICRLDELWKIGARDGKTLAAVALYEGLKREGRL